MVADSLVVSGDQAISSTFWSAVGRLGAKGVSIVTSVLLARLLTPEDFGLFGLASVIVGFVVMFRDIGVGAALVHKQEHLKENATAAFFMNLLVVTALAVVMAALAPWAAGFYEEPIVQPLVYVLAIGFFIQGSSVVHQAYLQKFLRLKRLAVIQITAAVGHLTVAALMASAGFGVWSISISILVNQIIWCVLSWKLSGMPLSLNLHRERWNELFRYGRYILGAGVLWYILLNGDNFLIGKYLGATALGVYAFAYNYSSLIPLTIGPILHDVIFPTFSALQHDYAEIRRLLLRTTGFLAACSFPIVGLLLVSADQFVIAIFGEKWSAAILPFRILLIFALLRTVSAAVGALFPAIGRPDISLYLGLGLLPFFAFGVWKALAFGVAYVALVVTILFSLSGLLQMYICCRIVQLSLSRFVKSLLPALTASVLAGAAVYLVNLHWLESISFLNWVILSTLYLGLYTFFIGVLFPTEWREFVGVLREVLFRFPAR